MKSPSQIRESFIIVIIFAISAIFVGFCHQVKAAIPQGESWTVPDNDHWHQVRLQMQLEYANWNKLALMFRDQPEAYDYFTSMAWVTAWAYEVYFGIAIT